MVINCASVIEAHAHSRQHPIATTNFKTVCICPAKIRIEIEAGCALDCSFCSTGKQGFNRNLTVAEIIGQLWQANRALGADAKGERIISNVVLMGMGEPLANFDNTVKALRLMLDDNAYGLSRRRVTVSTSGLVPNIDRLRDEQRFNGVQELVDQVKLDIAAARRIFGRSQAS